MKKVLLVLVGLVVAMGIATNVYASGKTVTKEKEKVQTPAGELKAKIVTVTDGKFTTEKGKLVLTSNKGEVRVEKLKYKLWNENDPAKDDDNTVIMFKDKAEVQMHVSKDIKKNHLEAANKESGTIYSTYNPMKNGWEITAIE